MKFKFLKDFNIFKKEEKNPIIEIIDKHVNLSMERFGLEILPRDIKKEKDVLIEIFSKYEFKNISKYSNEEYYRIFKIIYKDVLDKMEEQIKFYFYKNPSTVRTKYNCHLEWVVSDILRYVTNKK